MNSTPGPKDIDRSHHVREVPSPSVEVASMGPAKPVPPVITTTAATSTATATGSGPQGSSSRSPTGKGRSPRISVREQMGIGRSPKSGLGGKITVSADAMKLLLG